MRISYQNGTPEQILEKIKERLGGRKLGNMLEFKLKDGHLGITIKKMGTSYLFFTRESNERQLVWKLKTEKIALTHRAFKGDVMEKLTKVISQTGGSISKT